MGLLDALSNFASTDEGMGLAQGLLSARGSAGLAAGMAGMQSAQENAMKRKFMDMQMKNYASEIAQREEAIKKQQQVSEMVRGFLGGGSASPGLSSPGAYGTPAVDGVGPVVPGAAPRQPGLAGRSVDDIAALHAAGGPNLMDAYKWAREPQQLVGGSVYQNRNTGETEYIPKMPEGMGMDRNGAKPIAGYLQGLAAIEGAKANASESAKAGFDLVDVPIGNNQTQKMPRAEAVKMLGASSSMNSSIPSVGAFQPTPAQMAAIQADAQANGISNPFANFNQRPSQIGVSASPSELAAQEADKARQIDLAKADAARQSGNISKSSSFKDFRQQLGMAETLLNSGPTNSALGSVVDKVAGMFGVSPSSANVAASLKTLSGWMMENIPKAPGAQSDAELRDYKVAAGMAGDETVPVPQRLAALKVINGIVDNWESKMQGGGNVAPAPKASNLLDALPKALPANKGQRIRDTETGKILRSNGLSWVPE